jgi:hypothetical protein
LTSPIETCYFLYRSRHFCVKFRKGMMGFAGITQR